MGEGLAACWRRRADQLAIIFAHGLAALRAGRMHRVAFQLRDEGADVLHALRIEPAPFHAAPDGEQIGLGLIGAIELVPAFVAVDIELHLGGEPVDLLVVEDQEAGEGAAPAVEIGVEHGRPLAAIDRLAVDLELRHGRSPWRRGRPLSDSRRGSGRRWSSLHCRTIPARCGARQSAKRDAQGASKRQPQTCPSVPHVESHSKAPG